MKRKFIAKKKIKMGLLKLIILIIILLFSFWITFSLFIKLSLNNILKKENNTILGVGTSNYKLFNIDLINPRDIFKLSLNYIKKNKEIEEENILDRELFVIDEKENDSNPVVYIYNTHDTEEYESSQYLAYNIAYTVKTSSYILRDYLNDLKVPSYVESEKMSNYLKKNNLLYRHSYEASRYYIEERLNEYKSIKLLIDIHRDSATKDATTVEIDGNKYAKVLFVVGLENKNYAKNLEIAEFFNTNLDSRLRRGISKKSGPNVNGVYNQDLSPNALLIEVGGVDNNIIEVDNTLRIISKIILKYLEEK